MKNTIGLFLALLGFSGFGATYSDPVMVSSNGTLQAPTNFFLVNTGAITAALTASGWSTSSGNANTNAANAWSVGYTQTFLGPVMWSTTNAIAEVAGKQGLDSDLTALAAISGVSGDIIFHNGTNWTRLPKGTNWQPLQLSSGFPTWALVDDDSVSFDDTDNLWTATVIGLALSELNDSINAGVPNGTGAKVHWSQLLGVPAGFSDGTDDGAGGGSGDVVGPDSSTDGNIAVFMGTTGKVLTNSPAIAATNIQTITAAVAAYEPLNAAKYQSSNTVLTTLATLNGSALTNLNASSIASGTISSNRLPAAVSFTTIDVDTINASAVVGDASGLTGINATNVTDGELADARIPAAIARDSEVSATYAPLASPALTGTPTVPTAAAGTSNTVAASTKYVDDAVADIPASSASAKSHTTFYIETEFLAAASAIYSGMPWAGTANASGSSVQGPASGQNRPTISRLSSAANANSGYAYTTYSGNALRLYGGERFTVVFRPQATNDGVITRYGWHDTTSSTAPTDALMVVRSNFVMTGYAYSNSVVVPTATTYNISSNAWYRLDIAINGDGSVGTFTLFDESASQVWSDSVTNALPLSDARLVGNGVNTYNVNAAAVALEDFDFMSLGNTNILTR